MQCAVTLVNTLNIIFLKQLTFFAILHRFPAVFCYVSVSNAFGICEYTRKGKVKSSYKCTIDNVKTITVTNQNWETT